jgi:succinoglycan biosynthesis transport protein ExoP
MTRTAPNLAVPEQTTRLNPRMLVDAVAYRWRLVLFFAIVGPLLAVAWTRIAPAEYRAQATLAFQNTISINPVMEELAVEFEVASRLPVVQTVLGSREVAVQMLRELGEVDERTSTRELDEKVEAFQSRVRVRGAAGGVIEITFTSETQDGAVAGLSLLLEIFQEQMLRPTRDSLNASVDFLAAELQRLRGELQHDEDTIREFREAHADQLPEVHQVNLDLYLARRGQFLTAQSDLAGLEQSVRTARDRLLSYSPEVQAIDRRLEEAQRTLDRALESYGEEHPEVQAVRQALERVQAERQQVLDAQGDLDINDLERLARRGNSDVMQEELSAYRAALTQVAALRPQAELLRGQLDELVESLREFAGNQQVLNRLLRDVEAKSDAYSRLLTRYQDAIATRELTLQQEEAQFWLIEEPQVPRRSGRRSLKIALVVGVMAGFTLAGAAIFLLEFLDPSVRLPEEAAEASGLPVVVVLPRMTRS